MKPRSLLLSFVALICVLVFGGVMIVHGLHDEHEAQLSTEWPSVEGKILSHRWERHWHRHRQDTYEPVVWYSYVVEGKEYKDSRIAWYSQSFYSEGAANEYMNREYPIGHAVRVHYDPNHPHHACLVVGGASKAMQSVYAAVMMMVVGVLVGAFVVVRRVASPPI